MGVLLHAASAVASGAADVVVAYRAIRARSGASPLRRGEDRTEPDVGALRHHRDAVVHAVRRADTGVVDGAQRGRATCTTSA